MIVFMSETTTSDEPVTGPIDPVPPAPPPAADAEVPPHSHPTSRLNKVLAWVGIIAGSLLIASIIFGAGFRIGLHVGGHGGGMGHHRHHGNGQMERGGPPEFPIGISQAAFILDGRVVGPRVGRAVEELAEVVSIHAHDRDRKSVV